MVEGTGADLHGKNNKGLMLLAEETVIGDKTQTWGLEVARTPEIHL